MIDLNGFLIYETEEWMQLMNSQLVPREHVSYICPECGKIQSAQNLYDTGEFQTIDDALIKIGYSCIGLHKRKIDPKTGLRMGLGCDFTFDDDKKLKKILVQDSNGNMHPRFQLATPEQAQSNFKFWKLSSSNGLNSSGIASYSSTRNAGLASGSGADRISAIQEKKLGEFYTKALNNLNDQASKIDLENLDLSKEEKETPIKTEYVFQFELQQIPTLDTVYDPNVQNKRFEALEAKINEIESAPLKADNSQLKSLQIDKKVNVEMVWDDKYDVPTLKSYLKQNSKHMGGGGLRTGRR